MKINTREEIINALVVEPLPADRFEIGHWRNLKVEFHTPYGLTRISPDDGSRAETTPTTCPPGAAK